MTPKEAARIRAKKATTIPCPNLAEFEKKRMALEKAVKEDEKRAQKREKLLKEMKNATGEMKTTSPTNEAAKTKDESKSSLQAVRDAKAKLAQQEKTATRPGSAHGSTPDDATETSKPNKKDKKEKKEKKEKKASPQEAEPTQDAHKISKVSAPAIAEAPKSEHNKKKMLP